MPLKTRVDSKKAEAERLQAMVVDLLREEENKYCADCEAKQPRWASWNLGVFLCIRCAGIHRNLGVHLTKVKSVNLDSWTPEQVQSMRVMGNRMARRVYEAELPEHFRRPQTDSALESFIRAKYEHKRYILKDWSPPVIDINDLPPPPDKRHHFDRSVRPNSKKGDNTTDSVEKPRTFSGNSTVPKAIADVGCGEIIDAPLLDLNSPAVNSENELSQNFGVMGNSVLHSSNAILGIIDGDGMEDFGPIVSAPPASSQSDIFATDAEASSSKGKAKTATSGSTTNMQDLALILGANSTDEKKSTSDILALYGTVPKLYAKTAKEQRGMQQFPEVPSGDDNTFGKLENVQHFAGSSDVGAFFGPPVIPLAHPSYGPNISQSSCDYIPVVQSAIFGSRTNALPVGNIFLNRETAAVFAAASPFANTPVTTPNAVFTNSQAANKEHMDLPSRKASGGFAHLDTTQQPQTGNNGGYMDIFSGITEVIAQFPFQSVKETKNPALNHFVADFSQLNIGGESREPNSLQTNISWN